MHIDSTPGKGTSVSVFLPRAATPAERPAIPQPGMTEARSGRAVVLIVDDDDAVRGTTADVLSGLGYRVIQAADGAEALDLLDADSAIDVLLTDVVMPGMSGPALARQVRASRPSLPIIFISGYADPEGHDSELPGRLVRKPFRISDLRDQIEAAIDEARAPVA